MRSTCTSGLLLSLVSALTLSAADVSDGTTGKGDFPVLQLLPVGSVVRGISLPQYEAHRVITLLTAEILEVLSRHEVRLSGIRSFMYEENGETTQVELRQAQYDFSSRVMRSLTSPVLLKNPHYSAHGQSIIFDNANRRGFLRGPVKTAVFLRQPPSL